MLVDFTLHILVMYLMMLNTRVVESCMQL